MSTQHTVTGDFFDGIRTAFFTDAAEPGPEPEFAPGITAADIDDMGLDEFGERRASMGIRHQAGDFIGLSTDDDDGSGFPDYRRPAFEEVVISAMDEYSAQRKELGVRDASVIFGASPAQPRTHSSPYSI